MSGNWYSLMQVQIGKNLIEHDRKQAWGLIEEVHFDHLDKNFDAFQLQKFRNMLGKKSRGTGIHSR